jgi:uncharacterized phiE125 gp8 family phage protein
MSIPLSTIKHALKIDYSEDDTELVRLREAASAFVSRSTQLILTRSAQSLQIAAWTDVLLPLHPFQALTSVQYVEGGVTVTMPSTGYWVDRTDEMPVLRFIDKPTIDEHTVISIRYEAGYNELPGEITHCIIALVGAWYSNPEAIQPVSMQQVPMSVQWILDTMSVRSAFR